MPRSDASNKEISLPDITFNKGKDKLFIAICKKGGHSFVMLGVYDKNNKVNHVLCRVGKLFAPDKRPEESGCFSSIGRLWQALFGEAKAKLYDEGVFREKFSPTPISYQAYELSYGQYKEFIQLLEGLQTEDNQFNVFKPVEENGSDVTLKLTSQPVLEARANIEVLKSNTCTLSIDNNCRHSAIKMIEEATHTPLPSLVSTHYVTDLPYTTQLEYGSPSQDVPFYVLPTPPTAYPELSPHKRKILSELYEHMEHMLLIAPHSIPTQRKFQCLKDYYIEMAGPKKDLSLSDLLLDIQNWREQHQVTINVLRERTIWDEILSFFSIQRKSKTEMLFDKIEDDLQQAPSNRI